MAEVKANLDDTYFAWAGPTTNGSGAYFRIQGPTVFIEYAPQGNPAAPPITSTRSIATRPTTTRRRPRRDDAAAVAIASFPAVGVLARTRSRP